MRDFGIKRKLAPAQRSPSTFRPSAYELPLACRTGVQGRDQVALSRAPYIQYPDMQDRCLVITLLLCALGPLTGVLFAQCEPIVLPANAATSTLNLPLTTTPPAGAQVKFLDL